MFLQQFSFTVKHKAGRMNGNADGLSRTPPSTTVAPQLAAAITEATVESSDNFVIIREAQALHDSAGHMGVRRTMERVRHRY